LEKNNLSLTLTFGPKPLVRWVSHDCATSHYTGSYKKMAFFYDFDPTLLRLVFNFLPLSGCANQNNAIKKAPH